MAACAQQRPDAFLHHTGGLIRERDGEDGPSGNTFCNQVRDTKSNHARLARAGPGQNEQRTFGCQNGFPLAFVQLIKERHCLRRIGQAQILADRS